MAGPSNDPIPVTSLVSVVDTCSLMVIPMARYQSPYFPFHSSTKTEAVLAQSENPV